MAQFTDSSFQGTTVVLDGNEYIGCDFSKCRIVVTRGNFTLRNTRFDSCVFELGGEAANIKTLVRALDDQSNQPAPPDHPGETKTTKGGKDA